MTAKKIIEDQITEMVAHNIIEETDSTDFNSPILLVRKKDNTKRFVLDLRGVNEMIRPKMIQLPEMQEILTNIISSKPKFLNSIDLRSRYWQFRLSDEAKPLTSFTSPSTGKRYQFTVTPFGLNISSFPLQYVLTRIFAQKNERSDFGFT